MRILAGWTAFFSVGVALAFSQTEESKQTPATVDDAVRVIDLSTFPLIAPVGEPRQIRLASQSYDAKGSIEAVAKEIRQALEERGFKAHESSMVTPAYASLLMEKSEFKLAVTCTAGSEPNVTSVIVINLGNVELASLPLPADWTLTYAGPANAIYTSPATPEQAKSASRALLEAEGWRWFGDTSVSFFMRKNAVRLQIAASESPAQPGKSMLQLSTEQLSSEIPYPSQLVALQFSDSTGGMVMDSNLNMQDFVAAIQEAMAENNWKATTEAPVRIGFHDHLIFRSPKGEMADCELFEFEDLRRCRLEYRTEAQLKELEAKASEREKQLQMQRELDARVTVIELPSIEVRSSLSRNPIESNLLPKPGQPAKFCWLGSRRSSPKAGQERIPSIAQR